MQRAPIERILCPVDFSEFSVHAFLYASSLAQRYRARLLVLHVAESWRHPSASFAATASQYDRFCAELLTAGKQRLCHFIQHHPTAGIAAECAVRDGMAADCILSFAHQEAVNLIVMGTHGVRGFDRLMLGSVTETVLRKAHCSVLAVHHASGEPLRSHAEQEGIVLREILFCTDFSEDSSSGLDYAASVAAEYKAHLTLVHVLDGLRGMCGVKSDTTAIARLESLRAGLSTEIPTVSTVLRSGRASREIGRLAAHINADVVMMASHPRPALNDAFFGSTIYRVVQLGNCPVLAVHAEPNPEAARRLANQEESLSASTTARGTDAAGIAATAPMPSAPPR